MCKLEGAAHLELRKYREEHPVTDAAHTDKYIQKHQGEEYFTKEEIEMTSSTKQPVS